MQYYNPYILFGLKPNQTTLEELAELEERIHLQFGAYGAYEQVSYRGTKLTVQELRKWLAELKNARTARFHRLIYENRPLLSFLEYGHLGYLENRSSRLENAELMEFVAPYFAAQYGEALLQAIKVRDLEQINFLAQQTLPLKDDFDHEYFQGAAQYVNRTVHDIRELHENPRLTFMSERELSSHLSDKTVELYNHLPNYFNEARNLIAEEAAKLAERMVVHMGRRDGAVALLQQGLKLKLDAPTRERLEHLKNSLKPRLQKIPKFVFIGVGIILILFLLKWAEATFF